MECCIIICMSRKVNKDIIKTAKEVFEFLQPYCISIYLGGSYCQDFIKNKHDVDFICFADAPVNMCHIRRLLYFYAKKHTVPENYDFIQVRTKRREEHAYGSYINKQMIKLVGEDIEFTFDVIDKDRNEYIDILEDTIAKLDVNKIRNQKRWYQVVRGYYILKNNSYDLNDEEKEIINKIHDQEEGWEQYKITKEDLEKERR